MTNVTSKLYFFITRIIKYAENLGSTNPYTVSIIKNAKKYLGKNQGLWERDNLERNLHLYLEDIEDRDEDYIHILLMFSVFSMNLEKIANYDMIYISGIVSFLENEEIFISNFDPYLEMFFDSRVYSGLMRLEIEEFANACMEILSCVTLEGLKTKNYNEVFRVISKYRGIPFSPLFQGDYSLTHVYAVIAQIMSNPKYVLFFNGKDRESLLLLLMLNFSLSPSMKEDLEMRIMTIEVETGEIPRKAAKEMLSLVSDYWNFYHNKIGLIMRPKAKKD